MSEKFENKLNQAFFYQFEEMTEEKLVEVNGGYIPAPYDTRLVVNPYKPLDISKLNYVGNGGLPYLP